MDMYDEAWFNLEQLRANPYPGRGIIVGMDESGRYLVQVYLVMGRSENSRNRKMVADYSSVRTVAVDLSKVTDPKLIMYKAMGWRYGFFFVSNGDQTDTLLDGDTMSRSFCECMLTRSYEPDKPNFTPRIAAACSLRNQFPRAEMAILRRSIFGGGCDRSFYLFEEFQRGFGWCLTTYQGDGDPLPSFAGDPYVLPLQGGLEEVGQQLWTALNKDNRVSLAVNFIEIASPSPRPRIHIINRFA